MLSNLYFQNFNCLKNYKIKFFRQLYISKIIPLAEVQIVLLLLKKSINLFYLLRIFKYLDAITIFMIFLLLYAKRKLELDRRK